MGLVGEILLGRMDAYQTAVLATRHPVPEVEKLLEQVAGFAEMSSAIDALLADPGLRRRLAAAGRARAQMFAAPLIAETYVRLFTGRPSLLAEPARPLVGQAATAVT